MSLTFAGKIYPAWCLLLVVGILVVALRLNGVDNRNGEIEEVSLTVNFTERDPPALSMILTGNGHLFPSISNLAEDWSVDFFIGGGRKCGSTSLKHYLRDLHPNICMPPNELNLMNGYFWKKAKSYPERERQLRLWYRDSFYKPFCNDTVALHAPQGVLQIGEKSPTLIESSIAAKYIFQNFPRAKVILVVRSPMHAVYSHYWMNFCKSRTTFTFEQWLNHHPETKHWAMFGQFMARYIDVIPKSRLLVFQMEQFFQNTTTLIAGLNKIQEFLQVPFHDYSQNETLLHTYGSAYLCIPKHGIRPPMKPETYDSLKEYFSEDMQLLNSLLPNKTGLGGFYIWN